VPQENDNIGLSASTHQPIRGKDSDMTLTVKCFCGAVVQTDSEDSLVEQVSAHASSVHDMDLSRTDVLAMANTSED
jgi:hypothetical protein